MSKLKEIKIPNGVEKIESNAFRGCRSLKNITIPEGVQEIGMLAFGACDALKNNYHS